MPETLVVSGLAAVAAVPAGTRAVVAACRGALHAVPPLSVLQEAHHRVARHLQDHTDPMSQTYNHQLAPARPQRLPTFTTISLLASARLQRPPHIYNHQLASICKTIETPHIYNHQLACICKTTATPPHLQPSTCFCLQDHRDPEHLQPSACRSQTTDTSLVTVTPSQP